MAYQLGVYILLPKEWEDKIRKIKQTLDQPTGSVSTPHVSLCISGVNRDRFDEVYRHLGKIKLPSIKISISNIENEYVDAKKSTFYYIALEPHDKLLAMHKNVLSVVNILRDGIIRKKDIQKIKDKFYTDDQVDNIKKYGYARVMDLYNPHISLGNLDGGNNDKLMPKLNRTIKQIKKQTFIANNIIVGLFKEEDNKKIIEKVIKLDRL